MSAGTCSWYGKDSHGASTCTEGGGGVVAEGVGDSHGGIMLFGVRLTTEGSFRKSASMNNLSQYEHIPGVMTLDNPGAVEAGYTSDDVVHQPGHGRERKRGTPWTEEEHRLFLIGLQKVGKGDWRGISRDFVRTRTPTQVASHAQKYFLRRSNMNRRRRRSSLFDITTESQLVGPSTMMDERQVCPDITMPEKVETPEASRRLTKPKKPIPVIPTPPPSSKMAALDLNSADSSADETLNPLPLSLKLPMQEEKPTSPSSASFQVMSNGDSIITVA